MIMNYPQTVKWIPLDKSDENDCGRINPEVHCAAGEIWQSAENFSQRILKDSPRGYTLMHAAVAQVSRIIEKDPHRIKNLEAYLYRTFKRMVVDELRTENFHRALGQARWVDNLSLDDSEEDKLNQRILIYELMRRTDAWTRTVFQLQMLGHTYEEMIPQYGTAANVIRSRYSKNIKKLAMCLRRETKNCERQQKERK